MQSAQLKYSSAQSSLDHTSQHIVWCFYFIFVHPSKEVVIMMFEHDVGNQILECSLLGLFSYALIVSGLFESRFDRTLTPLTELTHH